MKNEQSKIKAVKKGGKAFIFSFFGCLGLHHLNFDEARISILRCITISKTITWFGDSHNRNKPKSRPIDLTLICHLRRKSISFLQSISDSKKKN